MDDSVQLRNLIRTLLQSGRMPLAAGYQVYESRGGGGACACCDRPIPRSESQYDVDCPSVDGPVELPMHERCFNLWLMESKALVV